MADASRRALASPAERRSRVFFRERRVGFLGKCRRQIEESRGFAMHRDAAAGARWHRERCMRVCDFIFSSIDPRDGDSDVSRDALRERRVEAILPPSSYVYDDVRRRECPNVRETLLSSRKNDGIISINDARVRASGERANLRARLYA